MDYQQSAEGAPNVLLSKTQPELFRRGLRLAKARLTMIEDQKHAVSRHVYMGNQLLSLTYNMRGAPLVSAGNSPNINSPASTTMHALTRSSPMITDYSHQFPRGRD